MGKYRKPVRHRAIEPVYTETRGDGAWTEDQVLRLMSDTMTVIKITPTLLDVEPDIDVLTWFNLNRKRIVKMGAKPYFERMLDVLEGKIEDDEMNPARVVSVDPVGTEDIYSFDPETGVSTIAPRLIARQQWVAVAAKSVAKFGATQYLIMFLHNIYGFRVAQSTIHTAPEVTIPPELSPMAEGVREFKNAHRSYLERVEFEELSDVLGGILPPPDSIQLLVQTLAYRIREHLNRDILRTKRPPTREDTIETLVWLNQLLDYPYSPLWAVPQAEIHATLQAMCQGVVVPILQQLAEAGIDTANL